MTAPHPLWLAGKTARVRMCWGAPRSTRGSIGPVAGRTQRRLLEEGRQKEVKYNQK